jgi:hypothetical protein
MGRRVKDGGGSEGRPVMGRIGIEPFIRRHCPTRKRADIMPFGRAQRVEVSEDALNVELVDGRVVIGPLTWYPRLWCGTAEERSWLEIIENGMLIHYRWRPTSRPN